MQSKFTETFSTKYNLTQSINHVSDSWESDHGTRSHTDLKHQSMSRISSWNRLNNSPLPPHPPVRLSSTASVDRRTQQIIFRLFQTLWPSLDLAGPFMYRGKPASHCFCQQTTTKGKGAQSVNTGYFHFLKNTLKNSLR